MAKALLIIDYTNDFVADNGSLTFGKPAQELEDYLVQPANRFYQNGDYVIFPTDAHCRDRFSPEAKLFPPHNVVGTPGQKLYGKVKTGLINIRTVPVSTSSIRTAIHHFKILILITTCGNGKLITCGLQVFAPISVSCTPQLPPII